MEKKKIIITIGREYGSRARDIGRELAKDLGINFYDKEILRKVSDESGINESYFHLADERPGEKLLYKVIKSLSPKITKPSIGGDMMSDENLFLFQSEVIKKLALEESCVIVGRCADYILKDDENVVKIFLHADMSVRVDRIMDLYQIEEKDAKRQVKKTDKERSEYYRYYTGKDWGDVNNFDLTVDSGVLGFDKTLQLIKTYLELRELI